MSSLKRKHSVSPNDSDNEDPTDQPFAPRRLPLPKRRRFDLTRNLSRLSLFEQAQGQPPIVQEQAVFQGNPLPLGVSDQDVSISPWCPPYPDGLSGDTSMEMDGELFIPVINHSIVEEPIEPTIKIPEVRMRHTSSYEPEKDRIVVTDLDSSEDEAETPPEAPAGNDDTYSVSQAFLSRVNATKFSIPPLKVHPRTESESSQALVLFNPSPWSAKDARQLERIYRDRDEEEVCSGQEEPQIEEPDANAMEIE